MNRGGNFPAVRYNNEVDDQGFKDDEEVAEIGARSMESLTRHESERPGFESWLDHLFSS